MVIPTPTPAGSVSEPLPGVDVEARADRALCRAACAPAGGAGLLRVADDAERRASLGAMEAGGEAYRDVVRQMGKDGWLGVGWPKEYGGQGRSPLEQLIFYDEAQRAGVPIPMVTLNTVGPTLMRFGTDEQKELLPAADPRRRAALRHRLHRAGRGHRPRVAAHPGGARRRRVRRQRPEGVHHRRPRRRLGLAGVPHRPRRAQAQGHLDPARRHVAARLQAHADPPARRRPHQRHVLRGRPRARALAASARRTAAGR